MIILCVRTEGIRVEVEAGVGVGGGGCGSGRGMMRLSFLGRFQETVETMYSQYLILSLVPVTVSVRETLRTSFWHVI